MIIPELRRGSVPGHRGFDERVCRVEVRIEVVKDSGIGYQGRVNRY